jgi:uncharacterized protein
VETFVTNGRKVMGHLPMGCDLLKELVTKCRDLDIRLGEIRGIGALSKTRIAFFDQTTRMYEIINFKYDLEILSMLGNISIVGEKPIVHVRVILSDGKGNSFGGQIAKGCEVYGCEYVIEEYKSEKRFERSYDEDTGLMLWSTDLM